MSISKRWFWILAGLLLAGTAAAQRGPTAVPKPLPGDITPQINPNQCGEFVGHFGPLDFRTIHPLDRRVVEQYHFDMELQTFLSGRVVGRNRAGTSGVVGGFDYVLKAIPNHPTALLVMEQLGRKLRSETPQNNEMPLECYYVRAFRIAPDDPVVRTMYGIYLGYRGRMAEATYNLDLGDDQLRGSGPLQHQIGIANLAFKRYDKAQLNALRVRRAGFSLDGVEQQLRREGKWNEALRLPADDLPAPSAVDAAAEAAASAAAPASAASASQTR